MDRQNAGHTQNEAVFVSSSSCEILYFTSCVSPIIVAELLDSRNCNILLGILAMCYFQNRPFYPSIFHFCPKIKGKYKNVTLEGP